MKPNYSIALLAGVAAAVLMLLAMTGGVGALIFMLALVPVPIALAGFSANAATALAAALTGLIGVAVLFKLPIVALFAMAAFPIVGLVYLALLKREPAGGPVEWYPIGRVIFAAALAAGSLFALAIMPLAMDPETYAKSVREAVELGLKQSMAGLPAGTELTPEQVDQMIAITGAMLPSAGGAMALLILLAALWLGALVARSAGTLVRPWPDIPSFRFPIGAPLLLAAALLAVATTTGAVRLVAISVSGALFTAYVLLGLAILHYVTRGAVWRLPVLVLIYALLILNVAFLPVVAMLGLADSVFPLRRGADESRAYGPDEPGNSS